jgi:hypothetical protein
VATCCECSDKPSGSCVTDLVSYESKLTFTCNLRFESFDTCLCSLIYGTSVTHVNMCKFYSCYSIFRPTEFKVLVTLVCLSR